MIERFLDLMRECRGKYSYLEEDCGVEYVLRLTAHDLVANGVIVLPCPLGTVYYRVIKKRAKCIGEYYMIRDAELSLSNAEGVLRDFGNTVFLTREAADRRIKELLYGKEVNNEQR